MVLRVSELTAVLKMQSALGLGEDAHRDPNHAFEMGHRWGDSTTTIIEQVGSRAREVVGQNKFVIYEDSAGNRQFCRESEITDEMKIIAREAVPSVRLGGWVEVQDETTKDIYCIALSEVPDRVLNV